MTVLYPPTTPELHRANELFVEQLERYLTTITSAAHYEEVTSFEGAYLWCGRETDAKVVLTAISVAIEGLDDKNTARLARSMTVTMRSQQSHIPLLKTDFPGALRALAFGAIFGTLTGILVPPQPRMAATVPVSHWTMYLHERVAARLELTTDVRALAHLLETDWQSTLDDLLLTAHAIATKNRVSPA